MGDNWQAVNELNGAKYWKIGDLLRNQTQVTFYDVTKFKEFELAWSSNHEIPKFRACDSYTFGPKIYLFFTYPSYLW